MISSAATLGSKTPGASDRNPTTEGDSRQVAERERVIAHTDSTSSGGDQRFGHPKGLSFLFATEMWERFSYYGMRALLVLYMVDYLLKPANASAVWGLATLQRGLEAVSGPLGIQPLASQIYGLYTGLVYLTPIIGGIIADRWIGRTPTVIVGAMLMVAGHFMMAFEHLSLVALMLLWSATRKSKCGFKLVVFISFMIRAETAPTGFTSDQRQRFFTGGLRFAR
jgi:dipeptide/tripeptide permease